MKMDHAGSVRQGGGATLSGGFTTRVLSLLIVAGSDSLPSHASTRRRSGKTAAAPSRQRLVWHRWQNIDAKVDRTRTYIASHML